MEDIFKLELVTATSYKLLENVQSISAKSESGDFTALANHERSIIKLKPCVAFIKIKDGPTEKFFVNGATIKIEGKIYCLVASEVLLVNDMKEADFKDHPHRDLISKAV